MTILINENYGYYFQFYLTCELAKRDHQVCVLCTNTSGYSQCSSESIEKPGTYLYNTVYTPCYTIEEICRTMANVTTVNEPLFTVPSWLLLLSASIINFFSKLIGTPFDGIHPDRVKKIMISTNINGQKLLDSGYNINFKLDKAIYDWYNDCKKEELS